MSFLQLFYMLPILMWIKSVILADVVPPGPSLLVLSLGAILVLGFTVLVIVLVSVVVIRMIKKKHTTTDDV